jgi:glycosyltransferase involved in cell wall biosynthesis
MDITVVVIAYNEERNIRDCLDSLVDQLYTKGKFEIIVVDGHSQDRTPNIVNEFSLQHHYVKLISNQGRTVSSNRNVGIKNAQYPFIAFTDADCICPTNWLDQLASGYMQLDVSGMKVGAVGGGNISDEQFGVVSTAIGVAFDTPLSALGSQQTRVWSKLKEVESLAGLNVLYLKAVFDEVGYFDEQQTNTAEDWIFNYQLREKGYRLFYLPDVIILHKMRTTLQGFVKQMFRYGLGRGTVIRKNRETLTWRYALPLVFLLGMIAIIPYYAWTGHMLSLLPLMYFPLILLYSVLICVKKKSIKLIPMVTLIFLTIHITYSLGEWIGLTKAGR